MSSTAPPPSSRYVSLQVKLIVAFTLVFTLVFCGAFYWFADFAGDVAFNRLTNDLTTTLHAALEGVDGDDFARIYEGVDQDAVAQAGAEGFPYPARDENPAYWEHVQWLFSVHSIDDRAFLYSYIPLEGDSENLVFIGSHGAAEDPPGGAPYLFSFPVLERCDVLGSTVNLGVCEVQYPGGADEANENHSAYQNCVQLVQSKERAEDWICGRLDDLSIPYYHGRENVLGLTQEAFVPNPYSDPFGVWVSAFAPIHDSDGNVVGVLGADYLASYVSEVQIDVFNAAVLAFLIAYVILFAMIFLVARTITRPTTALTRIAARIGEGDYEQDLSPLYNIRYTDEISTLAHVFEVMVSKVYQREQNLRKQVEELQIMVDSTKRDRQVQEIVDSDFFQDLQAKANAIKKRGGQTGPDEGSKKSGKSKS